MMKKIFYTLVVVVSAFQLSVAQKKKPNIIIILADDMGYSDIGCFGSDVQTPNLDEMASKGLKMANFYNASRCCPSRASLLTGLYAHQAGVGDMVNARPYPAYQGYLNKTSVTIAEVLQKNGYNTIMGGKWHVGQNKENWPLQRGFDKYFGLIDGANSYFENRPYRPNQKLTIALGNEEFTPGANYYSTDAYTDYALRFIEETKNNNKPFFLYLAYQAPHWPLHALPEDIKKYKGKFARGWEVLREQRYKKQVQLGVIDPKIKLSPMDKDLRKWDSLTSKEKEAWDEKMAVYYAMIDRMDQNIGKVRKKVKELGEEDNTIFMFLSDNGGSNETITNTGYTEEIRAANFKPASDPTSFTAYGVEGANVSNTPFRYFKHWEYEGGTATPFIAYGPGLVKSGQLSKQPAHIIDLMATCLDLAGAVYPKTYKGNTITPTEGISLVPLFQQKKWKGHEALYFEHEGNRAVRQGEWKLVSEYPQNKWELYNLNEDRTELHNLAEKNPNKVNELEKLYLKWADRAGVIPFEKLDKKRAQDKFN
ncbi:sulfatase [Pseudopedobacter saltans DSM 12145]|uniref:Sulfatase n=1 Tax=Pseudopedobacter saltans (strain ATCC 51119 / DSM 12145 / JCM 21818 / CCUG 39354 / LMG 10337 / NBRC 100064 / NCIMB 13643) TaxID=762903 RepID=F0S6D4_PSESL|nr:arylsulfatase [Pseudopedobacter saltans]ADY54260.1 sulfatase [Pseudopedobacter saltans DSM 12145]